MKPVDQLLPHSLPASLRHRPPARRPARSRRTGCPAPSGQRRPLTRSSPRPGDPGTAGTRPPYAPPTTDVERSTGPPERLPLPGRQPGLRTLAAHCYAVTAPAGYPRSARSPPPPAQAGQIPAGAGTSLPPPPAPPRPLPSCRLHRAPAHPDGAPRATLAGPDPLRPEPCHAPAPSHTRPTARSCPSLREQPTSLSRTRRLYRWVVARRLRRRVEAFSVTALRPPPPHAHASDTSRRGCGAAAPAAPTCPLATYGTVDRRPRRTGPRPPLPRSRTGQPGRILRRRRRPHTNEPRRPPPCRSAVLGPARPPHLPPDGQRVPVRLGATSARA
jgi:hypothetical protein